MKEGGVEERWNSEAELERCVREKEEAARGLRSEQAERAKDKDR